MPVLRRRSTPTGRLFPRSASPRRRSSLRAVALGCAALIAIAGSGCTKQDGEEPGGPRSFRGCGDTTCTGLLGGVRYQIRLPKVWNGTLLIYSHQYRSAEPFPPAFTQPRTDPEVAGDEKAADKLLAAGYALAGSAWSSNGLAVKEGVEAGEQLYGYFRDRIGKPK